MTRFSAAFFFLALTGSTIAAQENAGSYVITIQNVELKAASGVWVSVVRPDKQVDVATEPAEVSFINHDRVPVAEYTNFRISFLEPSGKQALLTSVQDFAQSLTVKRTSFIHAAFYLDLAAHQVKGAAVTVDDQTRTMMQSELSLQ
jgi:hypothetical protein